MFIKKSFIKSCQDAKNTDPNKYNYCGYGTGFNAHGDFSLSDGSGFDKNVIIFGGKTSSLVVIDTFLVKL